GDEPGPLRLGKLNCCRQKPAPQLCFVVRASPALPSLQNITSAKVQASQSRIQFTSMPEPTSRSPAQPAVVLGLTFLVIGLTFALPYRLIPDAELKAMSQH